MSAFESLLGDGLIRHAGVSNFSLAQWQEAESALGNPVLSNQVKFSLIDRGPERELLPWAQAHDRLVIAYSPLSQGLLSGRYSADNLPSGLRATPPPSCPRTSGAWPRCSTPCARWPTPTVPPARRWPWPG